MSKYTKKPVTIEARELLFNTDSQNSIIDWINYPNKSGRAKPGPDGGIYIQTLEGNMYACTGDFIIKGVKNEFYPCKTDIFALTYKPYDYDHADSIETLTNLQTELGYVPGELSTVAMLGLVGEAGEVLGETMISIFNDKMTEVIVPAIRACMAVDLFKKDIREKRATGSITMEKHQEPAFDMELSDVLYYLNILATNRGLTLFDLAQMSHDKVRAKQAAGGSSEDKQDGKA